MALVTRNNDFNTIANPLRVLASRYPELAGFAEPGATELIVEGERMLPTKVDGGYYSIARGTNGSAIEKHADGVAISKLSGDPADPDVEDPADDDLGAAVDALDARLDVLEAAAPATRASQARFFDEMDRTAAYAAGAPVGAADNGWCDATAGTGGEFATGLLNDDIVGAGGDLSLNRYGQGYVACKNLNSEGGAYFQSQWVLGGGEMVDEWDIWIPVLSTAIEEYVFTLALFDAQDTYTEGLKFVYDRATSANWRCINDDGTPSATTSSIPVAAGAWTKLRRVVNAAGTSVAYYIGGVLAATKTTNIPTDKNLSVFIHIKKTVTGANLSRYVLFDYCDAYKDFATAR